METGAASTQTGFRRRDACRGGVFLAVWALGLAVGSSFAVEPALQDLQGRRRIVLMSAASRQDPRLDHQGNELAQWPGAAERDVSVIEIDGMRVTGVADSALSLRSRYGLSSAEFTVLLIGKDGQVALRSRRPLSGEALAAAIDAMPMRRAGGR